jgi:hypothetical protein
MDCAAGTIDTTVQPSADRALSSSVSDVASPAGTVTDENSCMTPTLLAGSRVGLSSGPGKLSGWM